jgi:two-component system OmpR family response regulator
MRPGASAPVDILVIDDDVAQLDLVREALSPHGFRVRTETTASGGIAAALAGPVDLVLLDLVLPDMSGIEVVARLRGDKSTSSLPIILISAHDLDAADRARIKGDVDAVIAKGSAQRKDLLASIASALRKRS